MKFPQQCDTELLYPACYDDGLSQFDRIGHDFASVDIWPPYLVPVDNRPSSLQFVQVGLPGPGLVDAELGYLAHAAGFDQT